MTLKSLLLLCLLGIATFLWILLSSKKSDVSKRNPYKNLLHKPINLQYTATICKQDAAFSRFSPLCLSAFTKGDEAIAILAKGSLVHFYAAKKYQSYLGEPSVYLLGVHLLPSGDRVSYEYRYLEEGINIWESQKTFEQRKAKK